MFVHFDKGNLPIKIWQSSPEAIEEKCLEQAKNLARLPFAYKWIALMPDTHTGKGMPIGGVIACEGAVIPNAVGVDINSASAALLSKISGISSKLATSIVSYREENGAITSIFELNKIKGFGPKAFENAQAICSKDSAASLRK